MSSFQDVRDTFLAAATWHGNLKRADALLSENPQLAASDIYTAAVVGDDEAVRRFLQADSSCATARSGPFNADALTYLGLSRYLRLDRTRTPAFLRAATALLDAGAVAQTGFWHKGEFETALYGAAGVAHHAELTKLLLERGADPNDDEAVYHSPESFDSAAMAVLVESGRVTPVNLAVMLMRKEDWHDLEGVRYLLEHGANPGLSRNGWVLPIQHAVRRDNDLPIIELLLDHGADPTIAHNGESAIERSARRGRNDLLDLFEKRDYSIQLDGALELIAACARQDAAAVKSISQSQPALVSQVLAQGGTLLAEFAGCWNAEGVRLLLDLGVPVNALYEGDGYFDIAKDSTALHVAAWKAVTAVIRLLLERGASVNVKDGAGCTPLMLAVKACVDSYWTEDRTPDGVAALLAAGATVEGVRYPSGYAAVDALLQQHGAHT